MCKNTECSAKVLEFKEANVTECQLRLSWQRLRCGGHLFHAWAQVNVQVSFFLLAASVFCLQLRPVPVVIVWLYGAETFLSPSQQLLIALGQNFFLS